MDKLPPELLDLIFDLCDFLQLKALRATCKAFVKGTTPHVFEEYYMGLSTQSLAGFVTISKQSYIAKCIKRFVFVGDIVPSLKREVWECQIDLRPPFSVFAADFAANAFSDGFPSQREDPALRVRARKAYAALAHHEMSESELEAAWAGYTTYVDSQKEWERQSDQAFIKSLVSLPNLVNVRNSRLQYGSNNLAPVWRRLRRTILTGPDDWMELDAQRYDWKASTRLFPPSIQHTACMLEALCRRDASPALKPVTGLTLSNPSCFPYFINSAHQQVLRYLEVRGLATLTTLTLDVKYRVSIPATSANNLEHRTQLFQQSSTILSAARNLKTLHLQVQTYEGTRPPMGEKDYCLDRLVEHDLTGEPATTWPRLRNLTISSATSSGCLLRLLARHAGSLRSLSLVDCTLVMGSGITLRDTWQALVRQMPSMLQLEAVYFEGLWDETRAVETGALFEEGTGHNGDGGAHSRAVKAFVLRSAVDMPALDYREWMAANPEMWVAI